MESISRFRGDCEWVKLGDYCYRASRHRRASVHYSCGTLGCSAKLTVRNGIPGTPTQHNHLPELWIPNRNLMFQSLRLRSESEGANLLNIYEEEAMRYPDAAPHLLYKNVSSSMAKWRSSVRPPVTRTLAAYAVALANHPRYHHLLLDTVEVGGAQAILLAMRGYGECLRASDIIIADGTFQTVPAGLPAYQILTIHAVIEGHYYHPIVVLMENRRSELYTAVLQRLWHLAGNPRPTYIVTDYEHALQAALRDVTGIAVMGCYFHFLQSLVRRARQIGMSVSANSSGSRLVRLYSTLALLPAARVPAALAELPAAARSQGLPPNNAFHDYFVDFWMSRVGPECFSVYGRVQRTSNVAESFHAALKRALGHSPNIWRFTQIIAQKFESCATKRHNQMAGGALPPARRHRVRSMLRMRVVTNNLAALESGAVTLRDFLVNTSRLINVGVGIAAPEHDVPEVAEEVEILEEPEDEQHVLEVIPPALPQPAPLPPRPAHAAPAPAPAAAAAPPPPPGAAPRCGVCLDRPPTRVLIPCGHTLCADCQRGIELSAEANGHLCPYCRTEVQATYTIYLNAGD